MKNNICRAVLFSAIGALTVLYFLGVASFSASDVKGLSVTRAVSSVAFIALIISYGYRVWKIRIGFRGLLFSLPAILIAVNNFPWISILTGDAHLRAEPLPIILLAFECLLIGLFEETAFRGIISLSFLERFGKTKKSVFLTVVLTSAAFGLAHIFNLIAGAGIIPTLQQVGYSFLIGGMCSLVLLKTNSLPLCIFIHALYDFCGFVTPRLGEGVIWTVPEIIWTAVVAVAVFVFYVRTAFTLDVSDVERVL